MGKRNAARAAAAGPPAELTRSRAAEAMVADITAQIRSGALPPGGMILSGPALCRQFGISYQTVVRALNALVERGWLVRQQGRGTYVSPRPPLELESESSAARTVLLALDPRGLEKGRFGFAIVEALDEALVREGLRLRYAPLSAPGEAALLEEISRGVSDVALLIALDRPDFLKRALERCPGLLAVAVHAVPEVPARGATFDAVLSDDRPGGFQAGELLARKGHRACAFLGGPRHDPRSQDRASGFREALAAHGLKPLAEAWAEGWDEPSGLVAARGLLQTIVTEPLTAGAGLRVRPKTSRGRLLAAGGAPLRQAHTPDHRPALAVFCANDRIASGLYRAAGERGLRIPEDLSVVGFDDQEIAARLHPPLTTLRLDRVEYGRQAARLVKERLAHPGGPCRTLRFPVAPKERESVRDLTQA